MDTYIRIRVNYLAINVRCFGEDGKVKNKTLSVADTRNEYESDVHGSNGLYKLVSDVLKDFEIEKKQVGCAVTDYASNMVTTIEKLNEENGCREKLKFWFWYRWKRAWRLRINSLLWGVSKSHKIHHMRCGVQARSQVLRFGGSEYILGGQHFSFYYNIFLGTTKFVGEQKNWLARHCPRMPPLPMATGLVVFMHFNCNMWCFTKWASYKTFDKN